MSTITVDFPEGLLKRLTSEGLTDETLNQIISDAMREQIQRGSGRVGILERLQDAGVILSPLRQQRLAESVIGKLSKRRGSISRAEVEAALAKVKAPLSEEIIAMRGSC